MITQLDLLDILISSIYIIIILIISAYLRKKYIKKELKKYFLPFISFKIFCAIIFVVIHIYYYRGGDTFLYFIGGKFIANQLIDNPSNFLNLYFGHYETFGNLTFNEDYFIINFLDNSSSLFTFRITSVICLLGFNKFLSTTILFSIFSSIGIWYLFKGFSKLNPECVKLFAFGTLFFPTLGIWGSGILKDPLTIASIGVLFYCTINIVQFKKIKWSVLLIFLSIIVCLYLKPYILYIFIPSVLLWVQSSYIKKIENPFLKILVIPFIFLLFGTSGYFIIDTISSNTETYNLGNIEDIAKGFQSWHTYLAETRGQSGYTLGGFEFTTLGILKSVPAAIFVTYFRPLPFEVKNVALALESIESMTLLILTIIVLIRTGPIRFLKFIIKNKEIQAYFVFSILFGVTVGLTSYNFGALSRYKLPGIPFFVAALAIIYYKSKSIQKLNPKKRVLAKSNRFVS